MTAKRDEPLHSTFIGMQRRCYNVHDRQFVYYGLTGIEIWEPWLDPDFGFERFANYIDRYLGPKPFPDYSLDRIEPCGNYEPRNLRWASPKTQANNQRTPDQLISAWLWAFRSDNPVHVELAKRMLKKSRYVPRAAKERLEQGGGRPNLDQLLDNQQMGKPLGRQSKKHFYLSLPIAIRLIFTDPIQPALPAC
jgi:hypothetical protein